MGLAVARLLAAAHGSWHIHILDINETRGAQVAHDLPHTTFHKVDITHRDELKKAFDSVFQHENRRRLDFVFANAGVIERTNFYAHHDEDDEGSTAELDMFPIDVDLKGVILTSYLALQYFRLSPHRGRGANLVITASCGGLYPSFYSPMYSAAKCKC